MVYHNFSIDYAMLENPNIMYRRKKMCLESMLQDAFGLNHLTQIKSTWLQARIVSAQHPDALSRELVFRKPDLEIETLMNRGHYTCGRFGSTGPFDFAVSGTPSPLVLLLRSLVISVECFVSVLESPSCLPLSLPDVAAYIC